jgi:hypothetical protein
MKLSQSISQDPNLSFFTYNFLAISGFVLLIIIL